MLLMVRVFFNDQVLLMVTKFYLLNLYKNIIFGLKLQKPELIKLVLQQTRTSSTKKLQKLVFFNNYKVLTINNSTGQYKTVL